MDVKKMTTQENMSFEERLTKAAYTYPFSSPYMLNAGFTDTVYAGIFTEGAHWAREETIKEVLGLLRSDDAFSLHVLNRLTRDEAMPSDWADYLWSMLKPSSKPTIIMKDEIYKTEGET